MKIYLKPRGTGMTYDLIKDCLENNKDLIVLNEMKLKYVSDLYHRHFSNYSHLVFKITVISQDTNWQLIEKCNIDDTTLVLRKALAEELYIDFSKISIIGDTYYQTTEKTGHDVKNDIKMLVNKLIAQQDSIIMEDFNPTTVIKSDTTNVKPLEIKPFYEEEQVTNTKRNYILTEETTYRNGFKLHRIKCIEDFYNGENLIKAGTLGGFIEKIENLYDNAWVRDNAKVYGDAEVFEEARVSDNAEIYDNATVCGCALVYGNAQVYGSAAVCNSVLVFGDTRIYGNAAVCGEAIAYGNATIYGDAWVTYFQHISTGHCTTNLRDNISESIRCQCNLIPFDGKVIAYKQVNKNMTSFYDKNFVYEVGKVAEVDNYDTNTKKSFASGLHFSNANYWNCQENIADSVFLVAEIKLEDIIAVQEGKIRCRKALIIGKYEI